jgi:hypothetical protein
LLVSGCGGRCSRVCDCAAQDEVSTLVLDLLNVVLAATLIVVFSIFLSKF